MSVEMSPAEQKAGGIWTAYFMQLMKELKKNGNINPKHAKELREYFRMYNFANQSHIHLNDIDILVRNPSKRKSFLKINSDIESDLLDEIWFTMLISSTLKFYWAIESSLIALLRDVQYSKKGTVKGTETLGKLQNILECLGMDKHIDWSVIDVNFRNALAHGWFYRKKQKFVYYPNSKLKNGKLLDIKKLINKSKMVQLYAIAITGAVGEWQKLDNLGSKDPLRKRK